MEKTGFELKDGTLTVKPVEELDSVTSPVFDQELRGHLDGAEHVIVDFADVTYISSAGLRVILAMEQLLESRGGDMKLIHVNEQIMEVFEMVGFLDLITVE